MEKRSRNWCFTLNNYSESDLESLRGDKFRTQVKYSIIGFESGSKEQTPHLQGFIVLQNAKTFSAVKKLLGERYHIEKCIGKPEENIAYCSKDGTFEEFGLRPQRGQRSDLSRVKDLVKQGASMAEIVEVATSVQSIRMAEICMKYKKLQPRDKPFVKWLYGKTGTGKTRLAYQELGFDNTWTNSNTLQWFDGYDQQENVIIDDFRGNQCTFAFLLRLLDRYPMRVPVKGGFVNWVPKKIYITSSQHPEYVYKDQNINDNIDQLLRRIDDITKVLKDSEIDTYIEKQDGVSEVLEE